MRRWAFIPARSAITPLGSICWDSRFSRLPENFPHWHMARRLSLLLYLTTFPWLADEVAKVIKEVRALRAAGEAYVPVWKQIAKSIISWQTLLVAGVTVLTLYGKEITNWVASLFKGKTTIDAATAALEQFNSAMAQGSVSAQSELTKLNLLYRAATDLSKPYEERAEAVKKLQDIYPAYFGNMAAEQVMVGNAVGAYENLRDAIIEVAKAKAAEKIITENQENINLLEATGNAYKDYVSAYKDYEDAWNNQQKHIKKIQGWRGKQRTTRSRIEIFQYCQRKCMGSYRQSKN